MTPEAEKALRSRVKLLEEKLHQFGNDLRRLEAEIRAMRADEEAGEEWKKQ